MHFNDSAGDGAVNRDGAQFQNVKITADLSFRLYQSLQIAGGPRFDGRSADGSCQPKMRITLARKQFFNDGLRMKTVKQLNRNSLNTRRLTLTVDHCSSDQNTQARR